MAGELAALRKWTAPAIAFAGLLLCWYGLRVVGASYAITRWPVVPARVIVSTVEKADDRFRPRVEYELYLAGRRYVGGGITRPGTSADSSEPALTREAADSIVASFPVGTELLAGYDPVDPFRTVLRPRFNWWTLIPPALGAILTAIGIALWRRTQLP